MSFNAELRKKEYYKWIVLTNIAIGIFMATLDGSIVNVALPTIAESFGVGKGALQWAVTGYLLTISSLLLAFGRFADIIGKNKVYSTGFLGFTIGSVLCGTAGSTGQLVLFRIIQAVGAAMLMANAMGLVTSVFPRNERGRAMGTTGTVVALGSLTGPSLGGFLVGEFGWRSIFYVNIPVGIIGFLVSVLVLPRDKDIIENQKFDFAGAALFAGGITLFLLGLSEGQEMGLGSARVLAQLGFSVIVLAFFFFTELKVSQPMIDLSLFRNRLFFAGNVAGLLSFVAMFFTTYLMPFYLWEVQHLKEYQIGLLMTAFPLVMALVAPVSGWLSDRIGPLYLTTGGLGVMAVGLFLLSTITADTAPVSIAWRLGIMGFGSGMFQSPNNSSVMGTVPPPKLGVAGGVIATVRNVGMVIGVALSVTIFSTGYERLKAALAWQEAYVKSLSIVFLTAAVIALVGSAVSFVRGTSGSHRQPEPQKSR